MVAVLALGSVLFGNVALQPLRADTFSATPTAGDSLFDQLFLDRHHTKRRYNIPFPFSNLVKHIETRLGVSSYLQPQSSISTLVPLGRCISRYQGAPDYFRHPRIILAVDKEPGTTTILPRPILKDRLFIGYQWLTQSMEVISYNDTRWRFEFQWINDYNALGKPRVEYTSRRQCLSCHQNGGPIFSRSPWSEFDNNNAVLERMANAFSLFQKHWSDVCGLKARENMSRCRAGLISVVLHNRLAPRVALEDTQGFVANEYHPAAQAWMLGQQHQALVLENADIDNRDPLKGDETQHLASAEELKQPQQKRITWSKDDLARIIQGLGSMLAWEDIKRIDNQVYQYARTHAARSEVRGECQIRETQNALPDITTLPSTDVAVQCEFNDGFLGDTWRLSGDFRIDNRQVETYGGFARLLLGNTRSLLGLNHRGGMLSQVGRQSRIDLDVLNSENDLRVRMPSGMLLDGLQITWPRQPQSQQNGDSFLLNGHGVLFTLELN
ncbi:MAG: hypothetical protein ACI9FD_004263 [Gammaproteobacteria bacterium]|jgi:hypothetical protein